MVKLSSDVPLSPADELAGKKILLTGTTGFVGKVALSMLLTHYPSIGRIYALIRPGIQARSGERFANSVVPSPALDPLRERWGTDLERFLADKVVPIDGNVVKDDCAISESDLTRLEEAGVDLVINSAGLVDFDPPVDQALAINVVGAENVVKLAHRLNAGLIHVSTCYVNGERGGPVREDDPVMGYVPHRERLGGEGLDYRAEIQRLVDLSADVRVRADDQAQQVLFGERAAEALEAQGHDPTCPRQLKSSVQRQRKTWIHQELKKIGMSRAEDWGWQNTYTFTKSLGEQVLAEAAAGGMRACIVRPSIVESALEFPFPGWNEGFTTTAPLIMMARRGLRDFPYAEDLILDVIPVDMVAATMIAAAVATLAGEQRLVYQAASGAVNPLTIKKAIEFVGYWAKGDALQSDEEGLKGFMLRHHEMQPIGEGGYARVGVPRYRQIAEGVQKTMARVEAEGPGWARRPAEAVSEVAGRVASETVRLEEVLDLFLPFVAGEAFVFQSDNTQNLMGRFSAEDQARLVFDPGRFLWREYFRDVHIPGLEKWVFPKLEAELGGKGDQPRVYRNLIDLFEETTHLHRHRVAFRWICDGQHEHLTYGEVRTLARRVAGFLEAHQARENDRVLLVAENRPEWAAVYFGIQWAGMTAVPVDSASSAAEIITLAEACQARGMILSPKVYEGLEAATAEWGATPVWKMPEVINFKSMSDRSKRASRLASIIFTSGTTGAPKGVMLSHRNFTFEVSRLAGIFGLTKHDHLLSVLPLHHTFEFSAGLLVPFSQGASVSYLDELTPDVLGRALKSGVSGLIGVPALWELLERRIETQLADAGALPAFIFEGVKNVNLFLQEYAGVNVGALAAYPVHRALGGRLKHLVSGGAALNPEVMEFFRGLGFNLREGYGLTETAPVLTVSGPGSSWVSGSVGKPLAGVEIKIDGADDVGVGEVLARGPNIMQGYYGDEEATKATLSEGWFKTGDLGRVDEEGNLFIVGRQKDVIVDRDGRNVYPDELEELYGNHDAISELSVVGVVQPDGNEKVACLIVLDDQGVEDTADERERQREAIGQHFRAVSEGVPYFKRVKILHFWEGELPRTATRKVKRAEVSALVERLERVRSVAPVSATPGAEGSDMEVARHLVASLCGKSVVEISGSTRLAGDLSFDSLMMVELASALDGRVRGELRSDDVLAVETVGDIARLLGGGSGSRRPLRKRRSKAVIIGDVSGERDEQGDGEYEIPEVIASLGKRGLAWGQRQFYGRLMETEISGAGYIPSHDNFLVASNHCSHLDTGLVRQALGVYGKNMVTLAARDYFFESKVRRAYFENFTNIMAMERHGGVKQSLRRAVEALRTGKTLLIFPEGTRSDTGEMGTFKTAVGYLAVHSRKAVLPMYLSGTRDAMPKGGSLVPSQRRIGCRMGPALEWPHFELLLAGRSRSEAYRLCTLLVERAVTELREVSGYRPEELVETLLSELREQTLSEGVAGSFSGGDEGESPAGGAPEAILNQEPRSGLHSDGIQA